ncbi:MAG: beta-galactosidase [Planctomycetes bacterium]|nr:beta-galactosidase [Planctomycetota bacterium]MBL7041443.1 beta-galactosidase [Pirellulaceae bacterium]
MKSFFGWSHSAWFIACLLFAGGSPVWAASLPDDFVTHRSGPSWKAEMELVPDGLGAFTVAIAQSFPRHTPSQPGEFVSASLSVTVPKAGPAELSFRFADTFTGPTAGYHFAEVRVGDAVLFRQDVAGGTTRPHSVRLDLRKALPEGGQTNLVFRSSDSKTVSNFPVTVYFMEPVLKTDEGVRRLLPPVEIEPPEPLPPELPLPSLALAGESWTRRARIVQPWGRTQWDAIVHADQRAPWLACEFGFDAIIVLPPEAHNAITGESFHVTEAEFNAALAAYRAAGFRIILYSAVMHCGHAPVWQDGTLTKTHPEWSQRGPKGEPLTLYGAEWLCPSTDALPFAIEYARKIQRRYRADAVMLDNNEFFTASSGLTCYCACCQRCFRQYLKLRFGDTVLGETTSTVTIPTDLGPLYNLWLHWRNRAWAEAIEQFRVELRKENPDIVVLANTQYLRAAPDLATDLQYGHEDAVLSESRDKSADQMTDKLLLGKSLAKDRPLWNYLGTFERKDFGRLVSPERVSMNVSTTHACRARPWVVYYGFFEKPDENQDALDRMAKTLRWHGTQDSELQGMKPFAPVLSLVSLTSRNCRAVPLIPSHLTPLRKMGVCARLAEEKALPTGVLDDCRVLLIERAPCLSHESVAAIVDFVQSGGTLITSADVGMYDAIGRPRPTSPLWTELGLPHAPVEPTRCGKGEVVVMTLPAPWEDVSGWLSPARFLLEPQADASVLPYVDRNGQLLVYVCADGPLPDDIHVTACDGVSGRAIICSPDQLQPRVVGLMTR